MTSMLLSTYNWIYTLNIYHMKCSLDMSEICRYLPNLTEMNLTYGFKKYEKGLTN